MAENIIGSFDTLVTRGLLTHNEAQAVREIDSPDLAVAWLGACAINLQPDMDPPTLSASLESRIANALFAADNLEGLTDPDNLRRIWNKASQLATETDPEVIFAPLRSYLDELNILSAAA